MGSPNEQQASALRNARGLRTRAEWDRKVQALHRALVDGHPPELSAQQHDAQILDSLRHAGSRQPEDLLDGPLFPHLASPDFAFLRSVKDRLRQDVRFLRSVAQRTD